MWKLCSGLLSVAVGLLGAPSPVWAECNLRTMSAQEETVQSAYIAYYGRPADVGGLAWWANALAESGGNLESIIDAFGTSAEFESRFGALSAEALITNLYQQMFDRDPDAAGLAYYAELLASGARSLQSIALDILYGAQGADTEALNYRKQVAHHYINQVEQLVLDESQLGANALADTLSGVNSETSAQAGCGEVDGLLSGLFAPYPSSPQGVVVDLTTHTETYRDLLGVNRSPTFDDRIPNSPTFGESYNVANLLASFGVTEVRLHDAGVDLCEIYQDATLIDSTSGQPTVTTSCVADATQGPPRLDWTVNNAAEVDNPAHYDFSTMDEKLSILKNHGLRYYMRLGESFNGPNDTQDVSSWAAVARNIYLHAVGQFNADAPILLPTYVEIHNEPDGAFWFGSRESFYSLYRETFDGLKAVLSNDMTQLLGGSGFVHGAYKNIEDDQTLVGGFVEAVTPDRLDFFSAHYYGDCAAETWANTITWLKVMRTALDAQQMVAKPLHLSEWNIGLGQSCGNAFFSEPQVQSYVAGALSLFQSGQFNIQNAQYYAGAPIMGLFVSNGSAIHVNPAAWSFYYHAKLLTGTHHALLICGTSGCDDPVVQAEQGSTVNSSSVSHPDGSLRTVIANDSDASASVTVQFRGASLTGKSARLTIPPTQSDSRHDLPSVSTGTYREADTAALADLMGAQIQTDLGVLDTRDGIAEIEVTLLPRSVAYLTIE